MYCLLSCISPKLAEEALQHLLDTLNPQENLHTNSQCQVSAGAPELAAGRNRLVFVQHSNEESCLAQELVNYIYSLDNLGTNLKYLSQVAHLI